MRLAFIYYVLIYLAMGDYLAKVDKNLFAIGLMYCPNANIINY